MQGKCYVCMVMDCESCRKRCCINDLIQQCNNFMENIPDHELTSNEYQQLAERTINKKLSDKEIEMHAIHGMCSEVGEIQSIYQKVYQGHEFDEAHVMSEIGDLLWFIAEYCTVKGYTVEQVMRNNIDKLKKRYPEGFEAEKSLNRKAGDI